MKLALGHSTPLWIAALRFMLGAATLFAILAARGGVRLPPRGDISIIVSVGLLQMLVNTTLIIFALRFVPPGRSSVLGYTTPLWVVPLAMLLGERPTARILGGTFSAWPAWRFSSARPRSTGATGKWCSVKFC